MAGYAREKRRTLWIALGICAAIILVLLLSGCGAQCGAGTVETANGDCVSVNQGGDDDEDEDDD